MKTIHMMRTRRLLTEQQVLTAWKFQRDPNRFQLAPTLFRILREVIILERPLGEIEAQRGWPARSAKAIVSVLLHAIEETEGMFWSAPGSAAEAMASADLRETIEYLHARDGAEIADLQQRHGFTPAEARIFAVLAHSAGRAVTSEHILRALYPSGEEPDARTLQVHVGRMRRKLKGSGHRIETIWGTGFRLIAPAGPAAG